MENKTTWLRPAQMAKKHNVSNQLVNYWKKNGKLLTRIGSGGILLVKETAVLLKSRKVA